MIDINWNHIFQTITIAKLIVKLMWTGIGDIVVQQLAS